MDGSKSICYYDAATRSIKVSWNFAFNENDDLNELEIYTDLPDLVDVEGEDTPSDNSTNADTINPTTENPTTESPSTTENPSTNTAATPTTRPVWEGRKDLDYRKVNNPLTQLAHHTMSQAKPPTLKESAHLTSQTPLKTLSEHDLNNLEWLPQTVEEALKSNKKDKWRKAIDDKLEQLWEKGTWWLEELPEGREAVGCKWVFLRKKDEDRNIESYKAQLVAQGFS